MANLTRVQKKLVQKILNDFSTQYHMFNPVGMLIDEVESCGLEVDNKDLLLLSCSVDYEGYNLVHLVTEKCTIRCSLYRMPSGSYEIVAYLV